MEQKQENYPLLRYHWLPALRSGVPYKLSGTENLTIMMMHYVSDSHLILVLQNILCLFFPLLTKNGKRQLLKSQISYHSGFKRIVIKNYK